MGQEVNVVYETTSPQYVVERFWGGGWDGDTWVADTGFADLDDAKKYADEQQSIFPDAQFRVVDTRPVVKS